MVPLDEFNPECSCTKYFVYTNNIDLSLEAQESLRVAGRSIKLNTYRGNYKMFKGDEIAETHPAKVYQLHNCPELTIYQEYGGMKQFYVLKGKLAEKYRVKKVLEEAVNPPQVDLADISF